MSLYINPITGIVNAGWTSTTRPANASVGQMGFNFTIQELEVWTGTQWVAPGGGNGGGDVYGVVGVGNVSGISLTGEITIAGNMTLSGELDLTSPPVIGGTTSNSATFRNITITGRLGDGNAGFPGTNGQILSSTGNSTAWITIPTNGVDLSSSPPIGNVTPNSGFFTNLTVNASFIDAANSSGTANQVLMSLGNSVIWVNNDSNSNLATPPIIGDMVPNRGVFSDISVNNLDVESTLVDSTGSPGNNTLFLESIGPTTTWSTSNAVSFSSPPIIGNNTPNTGFFTSTVTVDLNVNRTITDYTGNVGTANQVLSATSTGTQWVPEPTEVNLASPPPIGNVTPNTGEFTFFHINASLYDSTGYRGTDGEYLVMSNTGPVWSTLDGGGGLGAGDSHWWTYVSPEREPEYIYTNDDVHPRMVSIMVSATAGAGTVASATITVIDPLATEANTGTTVFLNEAESIGGPITCMVQAIIPTNNNYIVTWNDTSEIVTWAELSDGTTPPPLRYGIEYWSNIAVPYDFAPCMTLSSDGRTLYYSHGNSSGTIDDTTCQFITLNVNTTTGNLTLATVANIVIPNIWDSYLGQWLGAYSYIDAASETLYMAGGWWIETPNPNPPYNLTPQPYQAPGLMKASLDGSNSVSYIELFWPESPGTYSLKPSSAGSGLQIAVNPPSDTVLIGSWSGGPPPFSGEPYPGIAIVAASVPSGDIAADVNWANNVSFDFSTSISETMDAITWSVDGSIAYAAQSSTSTVTGNIVVYQSQSGSLVEIKRYAVSTADNGVIQLIITKETSTLVVFGIYASLFYSISNDGIDLTFINSSNVFVGATGISGSTSAVISADEKFGYTIGSSGSRVQQFKMNVPTGNATYWDRAFAPFGIGQLVISPDGKYVYASPFTDFGETTAAVTCFRTNAALIP